MFEIMKIITLVSLGMKDLGIMSWYQGPWFSFLNPKLEAKVPPIRRPFLGSCLIKEK
jgi:hypothetical protein